MADSARHGARSLSSPGGGFLPSASPRPIDASTAAVAFLGAWILAQVVAAIVVATLDGSGPTTEMSFGVLSIGLVGAWTSYIAVMWVTSERAGSGSFIDDYGLTFGWFDVLGLGIGAVSQLVLLPLVYLPLQALWPSAFTQDRLEENAQDLIDRAGGAPTIVLVAVVVFGAPIVEELFYRGLLQRSMAARFSDGAVVVGVAAVFALVHFRPVEFPGLFAFGLVLGFAALRMRRLGMAILIHIGFNATALLLVH